MEELMGRLLLLAGMMVIACLPLNVAMLGLLRRDHPQRFTALGAPRTFGLGGRHHGNAQYLRFLFLRDHRQLGDVRISRLADLQLGLMAGSVATAALLLWVLSGRP